MANKIMNCQYVNETTRKQKKELIARREEKPKENRHITLCHTQNPIGTKLVRGGTAEVEG